MERIAMGYAREDITLMRFFGPKSEALQDSCAIFQNVNASCYAMGLSR